MGGTMTGMMYVVCVNSWILQVIENNMQFMMFAMGS